MDSKTNNPHMPAWDSHLNKWNQCNCGKKDCDAKKYDWNDDDFSYLDQKQSDGYGWCSVFDQYCDSTENIRTKCKICGKRACEFCSVRTARLMPSIPRSRICHRCLRKYGEEDLVEERLDDFAELFGYDLRDPIEPVKQLVLNKAQII